MSPPRGWRRRCCPPSRTSPASGWSSWRSWCRCWCWWPWSCWCGRYGGSCGVAARPPLAEWPRSSTRLVLRRFIVAGLNPDALTDGDHSPCTDREPLAVSLQVHTDHLARSHDDVLVQDRVAHHCSAAHPGAGHDHAAFDDRAVVDHDVGRQHRIAY